MKPTLHIHLFWKLLAQVLTVLAIITSSVLASSQATAGVVEAKGSPHEVVESVTEQLLAYFKDNSRRLDRDPRGYYTEIRVMLEPVIAFPYIARNVMARYWDYATPEQQQQFVNVFTDSLVETYVKGMSSYANFDVSVVPPENDQYASAGKVNVIQLVKNAQGDTKVVYNLRRKNAESNWQLVNVWLGSSNLGKSLKSQFAGAVSASLPKLQKGEKYSKEQVSDAISVAIQNWGKA